MKKSKATRVAYTGMLVALAFVLSYVEALIPISLGVPGVKMGLANLVVMVALYTLGAGQAFVLSMVRIVLVGFTFGNLFSLLYSIVGGLLSGLTMILMKRFGRFAITAVSVAGGIMHNVGQILVAMVVLETKSLLYYLPVLWISGIAAGLAIGLLSKEVVRRLPTI